MENRCGRERERKREKDEERGEEAKGKTDAPSRKVEIKDGVCKALCACPRVGRLQC